MAITLVLADDHPIVLDGLESLCRLEPDLTVLARCTRGGDVVPLVKRHDPDVLLLDIRMPGLDGIGVLRELHKERLATKVVLLSAVFEDADIVEALRLGVRGLVLKELAPPLLVECIRHVHAGGQWIEQQASDRAIAALLKREKGDAATGDLLTARERDLVRLAATGLQNKEIADRLGISTGTVKMHLHNVYRKLGLNGRVSLANYARSHDLA